MEGPFKQVTSHYHPLPPSCYLFLASLGWAHAAMSLMMCNIPYDVSVYVHVGPRFIVLSPEYFRAKVERQKHSFMSVHICICIRNSVGKTYGRLKQ